ncbi:hypothetical protein [Salipiger mucosus]|uniref:Uncharacterized protein n=1 Tax=Salipiger mucosus DSM 16094 TaxID=1123237 RepID=S9RW09_9RHOB|nr:hypothetical protein [Salipiger mucosus]EPX82195.1 hypothetical protein Salmuc_05452 [Salipiger mucosus DSM 16094]
MSWLWGMAAVVVLLFAVSALRLVRRFLFGFALAFGVLLVLHLRHDPAEGAAILAATGGGLALSWPLRRWVTGMFL